MMRMHLFKMGVLVLVVSFVFSLYLQKLDAEEKKENSIVAYTSGSKIVLGTLLAVKAYPFARDLYRGLYHYFVVRQQNLNLPNLNPRAETIKTMVAYASVALLIGLGVMGIVALDDVLKWTGEPLPVSPADEQKINEAFKEGTNSLREILEEMERLRAQRA